MLDPGAGDPALVEADVVAVRLVDLLEPAHRPLRQRHHLRHRLGRQLLQAADVLVGRHHQVAVRVREEVEDHEAALAAVDDQVRLVVVRRRLGAEDALLLDVLGRVLHVGEAPGRPDAEIGHARQATSRQARASRDGGSSRPCRPASRPSPPTHDPEGGRRRPRRGRRRSSPRCWRSGSAAGR